ncbi:adenosylmethionine decarboxylase domain-containing protein [Ditylenchus destructor]|uniref:Adenosylmethionine decarboxylase domain-containing protein n=1 Tax=Ditylenchus destructor TaxID=166010 RepID=A0AAD4MY50_9BILA|nr:adenosylmethionine decarboxylase domain-containing protein [Ditylenchus destructor]
MKVTGCDETGHVTNIHVTPYTEIPKERSSLRDGPKFMDCVHKEIPPHLKQEYRLHAAEIEEAKRQLQDEGLEVSGGCWSPFGKFRNNKRRIAENGTENPKISDDPPDNENNKNDDDQNDGLLNGITVDFSMRRVNRRTKIVNKSTCTLLVKKHLRSVLVISIQSSTVHAARLETIALPFMWNKPLILVQETCLIVEMTTVQKPQLLEKIKSSFNHEDQKGAEEHFFEGAEKLLEIWFDSCQKQGSLRKIPKEELVTMLDIACCHILHSKSNEFVDSYVLSESSMFVSDNRFILKTCGATKLLAIIERMIHLAKVYGSLDIVTNVYYSHGGAYCMGSLKQDRWYLYTLNTPLVAPTYSDHTLEILMNDIPRDIAKIYSMAECKNGEECTKRGGINRLMPIGTLMHEELFEPVGYSMNGLVPDSDQYVTIHITPEPEFCFVSFETNQRRECLYKQTLKVLDCFKPNKFMITIFSNELSQMGRKAQQRIWNEEIPGYQRVNIQFLRLQYDTLVYAQFVKSNTGPNYVKIRRMIAEDEDGDISSDSDL